MKTPLKIETVPVSSLLFDPAKTCKNCGLGITPEAKFCSRQCRRQWHNSYAAFRQKILNSITKDPDSGCWNWSKSIGRHGYGKWGMNGKNWRAHRLSFEAFNEQKIADGVLVLHKCDNRKCVNPEHLFEGDHTDNMRDMILKGRHTHLSLSRLGSKNKFAKLTEKSVGEIKRKLNSGVAGKQLAQEFNISRAVISEIKSGKLWKHVHA